MRDEVKPQGRSTWQFDQEVADSFDDMLSRSIPEYETMRDLCFSLGSRFVKPGTSVIDLGCSRGEALAPFVYRFGSANSYVGIEVSEPMVEAAIERFRGHPNVEILDQDLRSGMQFGSASLYLSVLTLQFVPIEYRQNLLATVYESLVPGGAFIFVEKILGETAEINEAFVGCYYEEKRAKDYSWEDIDRKRLSLEGVLVPVTASMNEAFLKSAGFTHLDCFWRALNFAGWIAVKT